jgi:hypothetical protein
MPRPLGGDYACPRPFRDVLRCDEPPIDAINGAVGFPKAQATVESRGDVQPGTVVTLACRTKVTGAEHICGAVLHSRTCVLDLPVTGVAVLASSAAVKARRSVHGKWIQDNAQHCFFDISCFGHLLAKRLPALGDHRTADIFEGRRCVVYVRARPVQRLI